MGNTPPAPKTYSPMEQAQAQAVLDKGEATRAEATAQAQRDREAAATLALQNKTQANNQAAYTRGESFIGNKVNNLGYEDTFGLQDNFRSQLDNARMGVPETAGDVSSYYNYDNMFNKARDQAQEAQIMRMGNELSGYTPIGWEEQRFSDTADDQYLDSILNNQYLQASQTFDAQRARGQLSDGAYGNAMSSLDTQKLGARSKLEDMGLGVLGDYRTQLGGIRDQYSDGVAGYNLGQNFDVSNFQGAVDQRANALQNRMHGDIINAVGDTQLFNPASIATSATTLAGATNNPLANAFSAAGATTSGTNTTDNRTTGTSGAF